MSLIRICLLALAAQIAVSAAVELQGHGRTPDIDRPLSFEQEADDVAALLKHLWIGQADFFGESFGGIVAVLMALRHPEMVRRVAIYGPALGKIEDVTRPESLRFVAYLHSLARAAGHRDRAVPLESYCTGLLLPGERKSVEPLAARWAPDDVQRVHQSLHHFVANAPWSDEALLDRVRYCVLPVMKRNGSVVAWSVEDPGFVKKGTHSVGVVRQ